MQDTVRMQVRTFDQDFYTGLLLGAPPLAVERTMELARQHAEKGTTLRVSGSYTICSKLVAELLRDGGMVGADDLLSPHLLNPSSPYHRLRRLPGVAENITVQQRTAVSSQPVSFLESWTFGQHLWLEESPTPRLSKKNIFLRSSCLQLAHDQRVPELSERRALVNRRVHGTAGIGRAALDMQSRGRRQNQAARRGHAARDGNRAVQLGGELRHGVHVRTLVHLLAECLHERTGSQCQSVCTLAIRKSMMRSRPTPSCKVVYLLQKALIPTC